jgi:5-methylcytosine-specific restriction enzyme subunit McrC
VVAITPLEVIEYETRGFDSAAFVRNGRVEINPEAQSIGKVALRWDKGQLKIQAGGMIGLVPLNDAVILQVKTRVPVARLEEIIGRSASAPFVPLSHYRAFAPAELDCLSLDDLLAARFSAVLEELSFEGLFKSYTRRVEQGTSPVGRVLPAPTYLSLRTSFRPRAHFEKFARTVDNSVNRLILAAGRALIAILTAPAAPGGSKKLARTLLSQLEMFHGVGAMRQAGPWQEPLPANRPVLEQAVELARLILLRGGIRFFGQGNVRLPSFLINMETVFENYVRRILEGSPRLDAFTILDGNHAPPKGAAAEIFEVVGAVGNHETKPDIVIRNDQGVLCVVDVKYKPCPKKPERSNLEQVLVYSLAYGAPLAVLIFPCAKGQTAGVEFLGSVKGISCYRVTLQLMNPDLDAEEAQFCDEFGQLLEAT